MNTSKNQAINKSNIKAKQSAFAFAAAEKIYNAGLQKLKSIVESLGNKKPSSYQTIISIIVIGLMFILMAAEASNFQQSMQGSGEFSEFTSLIMGCAVAVCAILSGYLIHAGIEKDEYSGAHTYKIQFYIGVILGLFIIGLQFFLSRSAGEGDSSMVFYSIYVILICLLEVIIGFMLQSAIQTLAFLFVRVKQKFVYKKMWRTAKRTDYHRLRYLYDIGKSIVPVTPEEEGTAMLRARAFYSNGGFIDDEIAQND